MQLPVFISYCGSCFGLLGDKACANHRISDHVLSQLSEKLQLQRTLKCRKPVDPERWTLKDRPAHCAKGTHHSQLLWPLACCTLVSVVVKRQVHIAYGAQ